MKTNKEQKRVEAEEYTSQRIAQKNLGQIGIPDSSFLVLQDIRSLLTQLVDQKEGTTAIETKAPPEVKEPTEAPKKQVKSSWFWKKK